MFPCPRSRLRIRSREKGSAVTSRGSLLISIIFRLNLMLTYGIPPEFRGGAHLFILNHTSEGNGNTAAYFCLPLTAWQFLRDNLSTNLPPPHLKCLHTSQGFPTKVFNVGEYRRRIGYTGVDKSFFEAGNVEGQRVRANMVQVSPGGVQRQLLPFPRRTLPTPIVSTLDGSLSCVCVYLYLRENPPLDRRFRRVDAPAAIKEAAGNSDHAIINH